MAVRIRLVRTPTDEELLELSDRNPGYQFERTADGRLVVSPTGGLGGRRSGEVFRQLSTWNHQLRAGVVFDSSTGFRLPDGSVVSPDASWVTRERWEALTPEEREGFLPLAPDVAFEVRSRHQIGEELGEKVQAYLRNGTRVAVLIDPYTRTVEVYRQGRAVEVHESPERVALDPELAGFALEVAPVFEG